MFVDPLALIMGNEKHITQLLSHKAFKLFFLSFGIAAIGLLDYFTGRDIGFSIFYLVPILLGALIGGLRAGIILSFLGAIAWFAADYVLAPHGTDVMTPVWNAFMRLGIFFLSTFFVDRMRTLSKDLEKELHKSKLSLTENEVLRSRSEDQLQLLVRAFEQVGDSLVITDKEGTIEYVNSAWERLTGYKRKEVIGKRPSLVKSGKHDARFYEKMWKTILAGNVWYSDITNKRKDGHLIELEQIITPVTDPDKSITHFIAIERNLSDRKRWADALRTSESRYRELIEGLPVVVFSMAADDVGSVLFVSPQVEHIFGYKSEELTGPPGAWRSIIQKDDWEAVDSRFQELKKTGGTFEQEFRILTRSQKILWVNVTARLIKATQQTPAHIQGVMEDITGRKQAELVGEVTMLIAKSALTAASLSELYPAIHGFVGKVIDAKNFYIAMYDRKAGILSFPYDADENDTAPTEPRPLHKGLTEYVLRTGKPLLCTPDTFETLVKSGEVELVGTDSAVWMGVPLILDGEAAGVLAVQHYTNPTAYGESEFRLLELISSQIAVAIGRVRAQEQIQQDASLLEITSEAVMVRDLNFRITYWNKGAETMYGWTRDEALGRDVRELLYRGTLPDFDEIMKTLHATGIWKGELAHVDKSGKVLDVSCTYTMMKKEGAPSSVLSVNEDITEKKIIEAQYLRTQRLESIGTLASGIAHDLNNLLAPILLGAEVLRRNVKDSLAVRMVETMEKSARRGSELVKQVLSFGRGMEGERSSVQVRHVVNEVKRILVETMPKSIEIDIDVDKDLWPVLADATQIHQVLMNLSVNARDAMDNGGMLKIRAENVVVDNHYAKLHIESRPGRFVVITVADTGSGMAQGVRDRIFDPFFTTKEMGKGTGLGLSTVRSIVKGHEGFVNVYSEPGKGTEFKVYFPAAGEHVQPEEEDVASGQPRGNGELILVVDDEAAVREISKTTLEAFGYNVLTAGDGTEAVAEFASRRADIQLVITDMMMPYMDGTATIHALQKMKPAVKIIAVSGLSRNETLPRIPGIRFLHKPYGTQKLLTAVKEALDAPGPS